MKNKPGMLIGFVTGVAGFLWLFKIFLLNNTSPADELAPGIVVMASIVIGCVLGYFGYRFQEYFVKKKNYK